MAPLCRTNLPLEIRWPQTVPKQDRECLEQPCSTRTMPAGGRFQFTLVVTFIQMREVPTVPILFMLRSRICAAR